MNRFNFLIASIQDMQSTIRAVDTKLTAILVVLVLPVTQSQVFAKSLSHTWSQAGTGCKVIIAGLVITFALFWLATFVSSILGLWSSNNPAKMVSGANKVNGSFFLGGIYHFKWWHGFIKNQNIKSKISISECLENLPDENSIIDELVFEQMKLAYIRDKKISHQKAAYHCLIGGLIFGFFVWLILFEGLIS
ncbi:hypothetical protein [Desulfonatronospira thiodismutans]|nr:hypothetical protein [Desulfonatronospira thiodismutans]